MKQYKVQVYLPPEALYDIRDAVVKAGGGVIGSYSGCMSWWEVQSCWKSEKGAVPYNGEVGELTEGTEFLLEFRCDEAHIRAAVNRIKEVHPYERPVINVFLLDELSY